jgi:hypothetical protein
MHRTISTQGTIEHGSEFPAIEYHTISRCFKFQSLVIKLNGSESFIFKLLKTISTTQL